MSASQPNLPLPSRPQLPLPPTPGSNSGQAPASPTSGGAPPPLPPRRAGPAPTSAPAQEESKSIGEETKSSEEDITPAFNYVTKEVDLNTLLETDKDDPTLNQYKERLLGTGAKCKFPSDPRRVIPVEVRICSANRDPIRLRPDATHVQHYVIKEGVEFWVELDFYAQHQIVSGLRFKNEVKKYFMSDVQEEMLGSFAPSDKLHTVKVLEDETPSGMMARSTYNAQATLRDDDREHLTMKYTFDVAKDWAH